MIRIVLIGAAPTPWDEEDRLVGAQSLPLSESGRATMEALVQSLPPITAVYRAKANEACEEVAKMIAARFKLRPRDRADLRGHNLGLWQGLTLDAIRSRFPSAFAQWKKTPLTVNPPEGEMLEDVIDRLRSATLAIARRNRDGTPAMILGPVPLRIVSGLLHGESHEQIAAHLREGTPMETIEIESEAARKLLA